MSDNVHFMKMALFLIALVAHATPLIYQEAKIDLKKSQQYDMYYFPIVGVLSCNNFKQLI